MGGNVTSRIKSSGQETRAEKIKVKEIGRLLFIETFVEVFKKMNLDFHTEFKTPIWEEESVLTTGVAFNGSTSYIMNPSFTDEEVLKYKTVAGDIDIAVPEEIKADLWTYLDSLEGKEIIPGVVYMGSNKLTISSIGEQINSVFNIKFKNGKTVSAQVDFEFLPFENNLPTEWAKFSHSSAFIDAKNSVKAVNHKFLIRSLVGGASIRDDIVIVTASSKPEKLRLKKMNSAPRMLKFSVVKGIRVAYEPMIGTDGDIMKIEGKDVYREILSKGGSYETDIKKICKLSFQRETSADDVQLFGSFTGVLELMKKYLNESQIKATHDRYIDLLWASTGDRGQELEVGNSELDFEIKSAGYSMLTKTLGLENNSSNMIKEYYSTYGQRCR